MSEGEVRYVRGGSEACPGGGGGVRYYQKGEVRYYRRGVS
jgi:hypothetical protein